MPARNRSKWLAAASVAAGLLAAGGAGLYTSVQRVRQSAARMTDT